MGSNSFGEPHMGGGGGGGGGGSSGRKGKKNSNSEKPKQPQRGLGVAQLEKIRLHGQLGCNYQYPPSLHSPNYPPNFNQEDVMRVQTGYSSIPSSSFSYATSSSSAASSASYGFHPSNSSMMGGLGDYERAPIRYGDHPQPNSTPSWNRGTSIHEHQHFTQPSMSAASRPLLSLQPIESKKSKKHRSDSIGSSQNSDSSDTQELDLELRLSL